LRELESEAESDRAVYAAFLNRAKEVGEQQDLNDTNSRIITRAVPPTAKSSPPNADHGGLFHSGAHWRRYDRIAPRAV
jgi:uncharacterized protein involved in exopolysaccharide biosynthesis